MKVTCVKACFQSNKKWSVGDVRDIPNDSPVPPHFEVTKVAKKEPVKKGLTLAEGEEQLFGPKGLHVGDDPKYLSEATDFLS